MQQMLPARFAAGNLKNGTEHKPLWVTLRTWDKIEWNVLLIEQHGVHMFTDRWHLFTETYRLVSGELLCFSFDRKSTFKVTMFAADGPEKTNTFPTIMTIESNNMSSGLSSPNPPACTRGGPSKSSLLLHYIYTKSFNVSLYVVK